MTLILNGTDNSATTPAVTGTDTDTGVYYPASNEVALATGGTQALLVNASQQVGIGVTPTVRLQVLGPSGGATAIFGVGANGNGGIIWRNATNNSVGYIQVNSDQVQYASTNDSTGASLQKNGITFPATQVTSSDANTLDDYEQGTFTPDLRFGNSTTGITYTQRGGSYTKIGRLVYFTLRMTLSNKGSASGDAQIYGLPFTPTVGDGAGDYSGAYPAYSGNTSGWNVSFAVTIDSGNTYLFLRYNNGTNSAALTQANFTNTTDCIWTGSYQSNV
jgi:hypothetical protein